jgi:hypothetical protein
MVRRPLEHRCHQPDHGRYPAGARRCQIIDDLRKRERNGLIELPQRSGLKPGAQVRILQGLRRTPRSLCRTTSARARVLVLLALLGGQQLSSSRRTASRRSVVHRMRSGVTGRDFRSGWRSLDGRLCVGFSVWKQPGGRKVAGCLLMIRAR